MYVKYNLTSS